MNRTIEITGTYGTLTVDATDGTVTDYEPSAAGDEYKDIVRFDLGEWQRHYIASPIGPLHILDVGCVTDNGIYFHPERRLLSDLCGPMGRVMP